MMNREIKMLNNFIQLMTWTASLALKLLRGLTDQRLVGFISFSVGIIYFFYPGQALSTFEFMKVAWAIDASMIAGLMIGCGIILLLTNQLSSRYYLLITAPLAVYLFASLRNVIISNMPIFIQIKDVAVLILIYRHALKMIVIEIISTYDQGKNNGSDQPRSNAGDSNRATVNTIVDFARNSAKYNQMDTK